MKKLSIVTLIVAILFWAGSAVAGVDVDTSVEGMTTYTFWSSDGGTSTSSNPDYNQGDDLYDLDHGWAYYWNIVYPEFSTLLDGVGTDDFSATLTFENIRNWDNNSNLLSVNLYDDAWSGYEDGQIVRIDDYDYAERDYFDWPYDQDYDHHIDLVNYEDLSSTSSTKTYTFTDTAELYLLAAAAENGAFAIAIDPDCHYYNTGIYLTMNIREGDTPNNPVPEPATMILFGTGLVALSGVARKKFRKN